jgi:predicted enzyme related to lactoylglutathione lyase
MSMTVPNIRGMSPLLLVTDLERSMAFYGEHLGFAIDFRYEDFYAGMVKGGCTIHFKCGKPNPRGGRDGGKSEELDLVFSVTDIKELYDAMKGGGVEIIQSLREMPYGHEFYISDPDGYIISFLE